MRKILIMLLSFLLLNTVKAQKVPGYLGKRQLIGYEFQILPSFFAPNSPDGGFSLATEHFVTYDYVISKSKTIGVKLGAMRTSIFTEGSYNIFDQQLGDNVRIDVPTHTRVNSQSAIFSYKRFREHLAPLSRYLELQAGFNIISYDAAVDEDDNILTEEGNTSSFMIGIGYGFNRVINDQIVLSGGIDMNISFPGFGAGFEMLSDSGYLFSDAVETGSTEMSSLAQGRVALHKAFRFKIGLAYLL